MRRARDTESDLRLAHWRQHLREPPPPPRLRGDFPEEESRHYRAGTCECTIARAAWAGLERAGRDAGWSPPAWILAAAATWLYRLSGLSDLLLLSGAAPDDDVEFRGTAAAPLVPLRVGLEGEPSFGRLVDHVERLRAESGRYASTRDEILDMLAGGENGGGGFRFAALVEWTGAGGDAAAPPAEFVLRVDTGAPHTRLILTYNAALFAPSTARRLFEYLKILLEQSVVRPAGSVSALPMQTDLERGLLLRDWQGPPLHYPSDKTFHRLYEEQAERTPDAVALVFEGREMSYAELNREANRVAHLLIAKGVEPESRVGVYMENSLELVIAVLGVFKAGAAYVPLSTQHPRTYLEFVVSNTDLSIVLCQQGEGREPPVEGVEIIALPLDAGAAGAPANPDAGVGGEHLCAVLYTSGSTGTPKGVELSHQALLSRVYWMHEVGGLGPEDRHMLLAPMHIARFVGQLFWPLLTGARMYLTRPDGDKDNAYLLEFIRAHRITMVHLGPTIVRMLLLRGDELRRCTSLENVFCSGEAFPADLQETFSEHIPFATLHKCYGLAETNFVTYCRYGNPRQTRTIGRPNYMNVYILDRNLNPVPIGVPGEICASGIGLARGFAKRPDLVARRFVPDPFSERPGERMYRTGDLGRWLPDGNIEFLGRADHQVKVRGYPVDLGEIEAQLARHPELGAVVVANRESSAGDARLVAYVVPRDPQRVPDAAELRRWLAERLPPYMIPAGFVTLERIPMRSGKIDRQSLPEPARIRPLTDTDFVPPEGGVERRLTKLWEEILEVEPVGANDNFFDLGGHSLLATRLISRIGGDLKVELRFSDLFRNPTVRALARIVAERDAPVLAPVEQRPPQDLYDLTPMQEPFYALERVGRAAAYNCKSCFLFETPVDIEALRGAWDDILRRHEALRTTFCRVERKPKQRFEAEVPFSMEVVDLDETDENAEPVRRHIAGEISRPFGFADPCLVRAQLVRLRSNKQMLLAVTPHIISDGWSLHILMRDLLLAYSARVAGVPPKLPALDFQYRDFALWYRDLMNTPDLARDRAYWHAKLGGTIPVVDLPTDFPRPDVKANRGDNEIVRLDPPAAERLRTLSQRGRTTPFVALLALVMLLMHRDSGQRDIIVGTPMAGRLLREFEDQFGNYVNVAPIRNRVDGRQPFIAFLDEVTQNVLDAHEHQKYPLHRLINDLNIRLDPSRGGIFDVFVAYHNYRNVFKDASAAPGLKARPLLVRGETSRFDLAFDFFEFDDTTWLAIEYAEELFRPDRIKTLASALLGLLSAAAARPDLPIDELLRAAEGTAYARGATRPGKTA